MTLVNWDLLRHPYNWIIVALMISIAAALLVIVSPVASTSIGD